MNYHRGQELQRQSSGAERPLLNRVARTYYSRQNRFAFADRQSPRLPFASTGSRKKCSCGRFSARSIASRISFLRMVFHRARREARDECEEIALPSPIPAGRSFRISRHRSRSRRASLLLSNSEADSRIDCDMPVVVREVTSSTPASPSSRCEGKLCAFR